MYYPGPGNYLNMSQFLPDSLHSHKYIRNNFTDGFPNYGKFPSWYFRPVKFLYSQSRFQMCIKQGFIGTIFWNRSRLSLDITSKKLLIMNLKTFLTLFCCAALLASCKNGGLFSKKKASSDVTGWNYNDKNQGGYQVSREKEQRTGPGLVFVQGGTFTMGAAEEDVMGDWNNIPSPSNTELIQYRYSR